MSSPLIEVVPPPTAVDGRPQARSRLGLVVAGGLILYGIVLIATWSASRQIDNLFDNADAHSLDTIGSVWEQHLESQRSHLTSQVRVLVDDTRIRSLVMVAKLDEGTLNDTLTDLRTATGASCLAVLDANGKIRSVAGADSLRAADLGSAPVLVQAMAGAASDVWTLPDRVLVVAIAPIRAAGRVSALLAMGFDLGDSALRIAEKSFGGAGAVFAGDRMIASRAADPGLTTIIQNGRFGDTRADSLVDVGGKGFRARAVRIGDSAAAGRIVWLIPRSQGNGVSPYLKLIIWTPAIAVALLLAFVVLQRPRIA
jgi:hypothetical protein